MSKVDANLQTTVPREIAERYGIKPGTELEWLASGRRIHVLPVLEPAPSPLLEHRAHLFDEASARQRMRQLGAPVSRIADRGWTREEIYSREQPR